jgi:hypothetical protein
MVALRSGFRLFALLAAIPPLFLLLVIQGGFTVLAFLFEHFFFAVELCRLFLDNLRQKIGAWLLQIPNGSHPEVGLLPPAQNDEFTWQDELEVVSNINELIKELGSERDDQTVYSILDAILFLLNVLHSNGAASFEDLKETVESKLKQTAPHIELDIRLGETSTD